MGGFKLRRKQLYAIILAGALATGSAPAAVFAAEGDVAAMAETSEETPTEGDNAAADDNTTADAPAQEDNTDAADTPADTPAPAEPAATEAPAQDEPAAATEAPAEPAQDQTIEVTPEAEVTEASAAGDDAATEETLAEGESKDPTGISITFKATEEGQADKVRYFTSLQAAINYAPAYDKDTAPNDTVI